VAVRARALPLASSLGAQQVRVHCQWQVTLRLAGCPRADDATGPLAFSLMTMRSRRCPAEPGPWPLAARPVAQAVHSQRERRPPTAGASRDDDLGPSSSRAAGSGKIGGMGFIVNLPLPVRVPRPSHAPNNLSSGLKPKKTKSAPPPT
jgi:hypothetical protein